MRRSGSLYPRLYFEAAGAISRDLSPLRQRAPVGYTSLHTTLRLPLRHEASGYRVVIEMPDGKVERQFQLHRGGPTDIVVSLAATTNR
jgi:hypothetical protein